jgi:hypothetical protein
VFAEDLEATACTPYPVDPEGFNTGAVIPCVRRSPSERRLAFFWPFGTEPSNDYGERDDVWLSKNVGKLDLS